MLKVDKTSIYDLCISDINNLSYHAINEEENWRLEPILQLLEEQDQRKLDDEEYHLLDILCSR